MTPEELTDAHRADIDELLDGNEQLRMGMGTVTLVGRWMMMSDADRADWLASVRASLAARAAFKRLELGRPLTEEEATNVATRVPSLP